MKYDILLGTVRAIFYVVRPSKTPIMYVSINTVYNEPGWCALSVLYVLEVAVPVVSDLLCLS